MTSAARKNALDAYGRAAAAFADAVASLMTGRAFSQSRLSMCGCTRCCNGLGGFEGAACLKAGGNGLLDRQDAEEAIRDLVEFALQRPSLLLEAIASARANAASLPIDYHSSHAANTAVYSVLLGVILGLDRRELADLGVVALFADVGLALLPASRTQSTRHFSNSDRRHVRGLMMHGVQVLFGTSDPSAAEARLIITAYEHHAPYRSKANGVVLDRHPYSRIVAVADVYDALRAPRPWRNPFIAIDAFRSIWAERDTKFDPVVVEALRRLHAIEARDDSAIADTEVRDFVRLDSSMSSEPLELDL